VTPCQIVSGVCLAYACAIAAKGRSKGLNEGEQHSGNIALLIAFVVMAIGFATGN
jgi:hypothetical protein